MPIIPTLESRFGRFAIPALVQVLALFQLGVLAMTWFMKGPAVGSYLAMLELDMDLVMQGQVWRLVTHLFMPAMNHPVFAVFNALIMIMCGRALEQEWGAFRLNLYVLSWAVVTVLCNWVFGWPSYTLFLGQTIFFAFATLYPDVEFLIYFILPVKVKWLAWIDVGLLVLLGLSSPMLCPFIILGHLNYLIAFGPGLFKQSLHTAKVADRRARHTAATRPAGAFFHQCSVCQKTEIDDPQLDFRVQASGEEICHLCRAKNSAAT
jgi:membrane associated rhomboid family serine protease